MPAAAIAAVAASQASVRVSSSGAQAAIWPRPPRPHAAPMSPAARRNAGAPAPTARSRTGHADGDVEDICAPKGREIRQPSLARRRWSRPQGRRSRSRPMKAETQVERPERSSELLEAAAGIEPAFCESSPRTHESLGGRAAHTCAAWRAERTIGPSARTAAVSDGRAQKRYVEYVPVRGSHAAAWPRRSRVSLGGSDMMANLRREAHWMMHWHCVPTEPDG